MPKSDGLKRFTRITNIATILVAASIIVITGYTLFSPEPPQDRPKENDNLIRWASVFQAYAMDSPGGYWPDLELDKSIWVPSLNRLVRKVARDPELLISAAYPDPEGALRDTQKALQIPAVNYSLLNDVMSESYGYFGYAVQNLAQFELLCAARASDNLPDDEADPDSKLYKLRNGVERRLFDNLPDTEAVTEAQSQIPVLIDIAAWRANPESATYAGTEVLFMDGHVEFLSLGVFPVVPQVLDVMSGNVALDRFVGAQ